MEAQGKAMEKVLVCGTVHALFEGVATILAELGYEAVDCGELAPSDIDCGLAHVDNDVCVASIAMIGQYISWFKAHGYDKCRLVLAPELCRDCRSTGIVPLISCAFARAGIDGVGTVGFTSPQLRSSCRAESAPTIEKDGPVIGICGNTPIITSGYFRKDVMGHLKDCACQAVLVPEQRITDERDFLTPALEYFDEHGVDTVICMLPFGCLGGHVFARGQLRRLTAQRFPKMQVTFLDYDPSISKVNLVNRTELVIQAAQEAQRDRAAR